MSTVVEGLILSALRNMGHDTTCGACMEIAFTGRTVESHTCSVRNYSRGRISDLAKELGECAHTDDIVSACISGMNEHASDRGILISMVRYLSQNRKELWKICSRLTELQPPPAIHITCQRCGFTPDIPGMFVSKGKEDASKG